MNHSILAERERAKRRNRRRAWCSSFLFWREAAADAFAFGTCAEETDWEERDIRVVQQRWGTRNRCELLLPRAPPSQLTLAFSRVRTNEEKVLKAWRSSWLFFLCVLLFTFPIKADSFNRWLLCVCDEPDGADQLKDPFSTSWNRCGNIVQPCPPPQKCVIFFSLVRCCQWKWTATKTTAMCWRLKMAAFDCCCPSSLKRNVNINWRIYIGSTRYFDRLHLCAVEWTSSWFSFTPALYAVSCHRCKRPPTVLYFVYVTRRRGRCPWGRTVSIL